MSVVPAAFAFQFSLPVARIESMPMRGKRLLNLGDEHRLLWPGSSLVDRAGDVCLKAGWNAMGIGFQIEVTGKKHPPVSRPDRPAETDGFQIWLDTRNTQTIHRANRFCHHFCVLPNGAGASGKDPLVKQLLISRALEDAPVTESKPFNVACESLSNGYRLEVWFDARQLNGFDSESSPRLGFFARLNDVERGNQSLTVADEFPFANDPSLWQTLELREAK